MKFSYFQYEFKHVPIGTVYRRGLREFLLDYCAHPDMDFKNQFLKDGENLYVVPLEAQLFGFIQTRSGETINKINRSDLSHSDIYESLLQDERLGFMSYVFVDEECFAFGSSQLAPRVTAFIDFIGMLLGRLHRNADWQFVPRPILRESTRAEVLSMSFIGKTVIQVEPGNQLYNDFRNLFGGAVQNYDEMDSFEVVLRPKNRKNIKPVVDRLLTSVPDEHLRKLIVKAKEHSQENLEELYLAGRGHLSDSIQANSASVGSRIRLKMEQNQHLASKRQELIREQEPAQHMVPPFISGITVRSWDSGVLPLPAP